MDNQLSRDLLSDLPLGIIESILLLLPIRDAIRTSILSSKWRYKWTNLPELVFEDYSIQDPIDEISVKIFVTRTLFLHDGPIHKFKLNVSRMDSCPDTDQWLLFLSRKDIKELILSTGEGEHEYFQVPSCLYSFTNLNHLELNGSQFGSPSPTFKGFMWLRSLILAFVEVPSGTIETLVANSPLLENLELTYAGDSDLRISAPNLKYFCAEGAVSQEIYLCAPLLAKISMKLHPENVFVPKPPQQKHLVCYYNKFLGSLMNLESLIGEELFLKYLSVGIEYCHHPLVFHHLKVIEIEVNFEDMDEILVAVRLIMDAVNLHELRVRSYGEEEADSKAPQMQFWDSECHQNRTFKSLKIIKIIDFYGAVPEMKFIKFLLESSPALETMIVEPLQHRTTEQDVLDLIAELLNFCRASPNAKIFLKERP